MATTTYIEAAAGLDEDPAIVRDTVHHSDGPGPDVMDAASLTGDDVVNATGDDLGTRWRRIGGTTLYRPRAVEMRATAGAPTSRGRRTGRDAAHAVFRAQDPTSMRRAVRIGTPGRWNSSTRFSSL
jgi:hypothetical protein